ncbi:MAG TPA: hypothetical protein PLL53_17590 [Saprospiraceae bacterium]|nr:hypothetical protein [Saprospiraceae bacterium]
MKKQLSLLVFTALIFSSLHGQIWMDIGIKGSYGLGVLLNSNLMQDNSHEMRLGTGYAYGGKAGLNFGDRHGFTFDAILAKNSQTYDFKTSLIEVNNNELAWENLHLYVMYRMQADGVYFELGPRFSTLRQVSHTFGGADITGNNNYAEKATGAALGWGGYLFGNEFFALMFGMRIDYAITDFVSETGQADNYPAPYRFPGYDTYKPTNPLTGQIVLELNFGLGGYAKTRCGQRAFVFGRRW